MHTRDSGGNELRNTSLAVATPVHGPRLSMGILPVPSSASVHTLIYFGTQVAPEVRPLGCLCVDLYMYNACASCLLLSACLHVVPAHCLACMRIFGRAVVFAHMRIFLHDLCLDLQPSLLGPDTA